jgi:hypothetical protein
MAAAGGQLCGGLPRDSIVRQDDQQAQDVGVAQDPRLGNHRPVVRCDRRGDEPDTPPARSLLAAAPRTEPPVYRDHAGEQGHAADDQRQRDRERDEIVVAVVQRPGQPVEHVTE